MSPLCATETESSPGLVTDDDPGFASSAPSNRVTADLEMGEVGASNDDGGRLRSASRQFDNLPAVAIRHELHPRPLAMSDPHFVPCHPLSVSYVYTTPSAAATSDLLRFAILDTTASSSSTYTDTLYQLRQDILRSLADLTYLDSLRGNGSLHALPSHLAALVALSKAIPHRIQALCKL